METPDNNNQLEASSVDAGRGASWLIEGFSLFRRDWLAWIGLAILLIILVMVSSVIPVANLLVPVLLPIIVAGLMLACREQDQGGEISIALVFSGFSNKPLQLALIGISYLLASVAIFVLMLILVLIILGGIESIAQLNLENPEIIMQHSVNLLLAALIGLLLYVPVIMAMWFAPVLIVFHDMTAIQAMLLSIKGCLVNVLPFLVYGILTLVLMIVASIPLLLGWLILIPVLIASIFVSYKDVFTDSGEGELSTDPG